jgi:uncharacterized protein (TIGR03083 family)
MTLTDVTTDTTLPGHQEAMALAATEYRRFVDLLESLTPQDWTAPTDCPPWDVRATVAHNLGNMAANASMREMAHQMRISTKRSKAGGTVMVDELTALQISERGNLTPAELLTSVSTTAPRALAGRRRMPSIMRRLVKFAAPPPFPRISLGYLCDTIFTRDVWMHRVDICRATGRDMVLTAEHDGRLVAAIVGEWATTHNQPYDLVLDGPAGGHFARGDAGEQLHLDAVQFCRILSGRDAAAAQGLLATPVLY